MALPTHLDDIRETTPKNMVEDEITHEIPDTRWTTSIWSEADIPQKKKPNLVQGPWEHGSMSGSRVRVTDEKSREIRHKTDKNILIFLVWVYFLQVTSSQSGLHSRSVTDRACRAWIKRLLTTVRSLDSMTT